MDPQLPDAGKPGRRWRHDWYSYERYRVVHDSYMKRLRAEGLVLRDFMSFLESEELSGGLAAVQLSGIVVCAEEVLIRIDKKMLVRRDGRNRYQVKTEFYQYHAMTAGFGGRTRRNLIRYDNAHEGRLHRHVFNAAGDEIRIVDVPLEAMPTLDEFVRIRVSLARRE